MKKVISFTKKMIFYFASVSAVGGYMGGYGAVWGCIGLYGDV